MPAPMDTSPNLGLPIPNADGENLSPQLRALVLALDDEIKSLGLGTYYASDYDDLIVTVPAPSAAPTLTAVAVSSGNFTGGTTYQVAYTYLVWDGTTVNETGLSPVTSFVATTGQSIAVLPIASLANTSKWAVGTVFYLSADGGSTWHQSSNYYGGNAGLVAFGDDGVFGGVPIVWNGSGAAPPAGGTSRSTKQGQTVSVPATAPTVTMLTKIPATTYYGAYAYVAGDGTTGALSAISSGVAVIAGKYINFVRTVEPPSGAVAVKLYLGTSATAGAMKYQQTVPLHFVQSMIHVYDSSGAAHSAGTALSTLSGFQQGRDAALEAGGGEVVVSESVDTQVPIILRQKNTAGTTVTGIRVRGIGHDSNGTTAAVKIHYTGTISGIVGIVASGQSMSWSDLDFADPNSRVKYGIGACDFTGGGGFHSGWRRSTFQANAAGGIGYQIPINGGTSHVTSEQYFEECGLSGKAWGIDIRNGQSGDLFFRNCTPQSQGDSNSANSGNIRVAAGFNIHIENSVTSGNREYALFFSAGDVAHSQGGGSASVKLSGFFNDAADTLPFHVYSSLGNGFSAYLLNNKFQNSHTDTFALYSSVCPAHIVLLGNSGGGNGLINYTAVSGYTSDYLPSIVELGPDGFFSVGSTYSVKVISPVVTYTYPTIQTWVSALGLYNAAGQLSTLGTNAAGELVLVPYSGLVQLPSSNLNGSSSPFHSLSNAGTIKAYIALPTASASFQANAAANDLVIRTQGGKIFLDTNSGSGTSALVIDGANGKGVFGSDLTASGLIKAGSTPVTLTDSAGKILSAALNTVATANGGTGRTTAWTSGEAVLASAFTLNAANGVFQDTGLSVTLPEAGTYLVTADIRPGIDSGTGTNWYEVAKLYNSTDAADVANSETVLLSSFSSIAISFRGPQITINKIITVAASKVIKLYVCRSTDGTFAYSKIDSDANGRTRMSYRQISN